MSKSRKLVIPVLVMLLLLAGALSTSTGSKQIVIDDLVTGTATDIIGTGIYRFV